MLKPFVLAAALTAGCSPLAAAAPITSSSTMLTDNISVSRVKYVRDRAPTSPRRRNYTIALSMGFLVSLIVAAVATD